MAFSGMSATFVSLCVIFFTVILIFVSSSYLRRRHLRLLEGNIAARRQQRADADLRDNDRARSRRALMRQAILRLVERGEAYQGIPLVSTANGTDMLADRQLRSYRARNGEHRRPELLLMQDGRHATVSSIVSMVQANHTPPPEAPPGPNLLQMLVETSARRQGSEPLQRGETVDTLLEQLQHLQEEEEEEEEEAREREAQPDAEEVYGKGLPYLLNPANEGVVYFIDDDAEYDALLCQQHLARSKSALEWILTPLLKRKNGPSFENPRRAME
ncbi:hypothetical protein BCY84_12489 [Trypanosoma cruzi cruzi]|uniref:Uncharacterized protein n=1 Tax=Trypanosoma cruzi TaxID=5693 RepID=A0A2V2URK4_TRYCR|nr:hypothetical protein BCY84_12489 [Trypanosoma cruzi cruzi]PWU85458.1 hypothetical protein C4B63_161g27 [Trypanosoma cruzi]